MDRLAALYARYDGPLPRPALPYRQDEAAYLLRAALLLRRIYRHHRQLDRAATQSLYINALIRQLRRP